MKKSVFISGVAILNIVLILTTIGLFNPSNLNLFELQFFNGFDITNLFPSYGISNFYLFSTIVSLVFINVLLVKILKVKNISLK
jgi:hypothetical protein